MSDLEGFWATVQCLGPVHPYHPREPDYAPEDVRGAPPSTPEDTLLVVERHRSRYWKAMAGSYEAHVQAGTSTVGAAKEAWLAKRDACRTEAREALESLSALGALP